MVVGHGSPCESFDDHMHCMVFSHVHCKEILTKKLPYWYLHSELLVVWELLAEREPANPSDFSTWSILGICLWEVARPCWKIDPSQRPTTGRLLDSLAQIRN